MKGLYATMDPMLEEAITSSSPAHESSEENEKKPIVVIGGGGQVQDLISVLRRSELYTLLGYFSEKESKLDIPYLGFTGEATRVVYDCFLAVLGEEGEGDACDREKLVEYFGGMGFQFPVIISPGAIVNDLVTVGRGSVVMDGVVIQPQVTIGRFSILNINSTIDHDCSLGTYVHVARNATLGCGVRVGNYSHIGAGASIEPGVRVDDYITIDTGAGVVTDCVRDLKDPDVYEKYMSGDRLLYSGSPAVLVE